MAHAPLSAAAGVLGALLWLLGRWSPGRLTGPPDPDASPLEQPRAAVALLLLLLGVGLGFLRGAPGHPAPVRRAWVGLAAWSALWAGWLLLAGVWAPDAQLALHKALELGVLFLGAAGLAAVLWYGDPQACRAGLLAAGGGALLVLALAGLAAERSGRAAVLGGGPNVFGRNMGALAVLALGAWQARRSRLWLLVAGASALLVLLSGSRGALAATLAGVAVGALLADRSILRRAAIPAGLALATGLVLLIDSSQGEAAREMFGQRVLEMTVGRGHLGYRDEYFAQALSLMRQAPLRGVGLAGYPALTPAPYPHNLPLEVASETGLTGLLLLLGVGAAWIRLLGRLRPLDATGLGVWTVQLVSAQVSGDLYDSRGLLLWGLISLAPGLARTRGSAAVSSDPRESASPSSVGARP